MTKRNSIIQIVSDGDGVIFESLLIEGLNYAQEINSSEEVQAPDVLIIEKKINVKDWKPVLDHLLASGKTVIFPRPGSDLEECFSIQKSGAWERGYLLNDGTNGYENEKLQVFDVALYQGGETLKPMMDVVGGTETFPGIACKKVDQGNLIFYSFDLPKTIIRLTHGNNIRFRDHQEGVMRTDMGIVCERSKAQIPQADILRRMFCGLIEDHSPLPLPKLWYFPFNRSSGLCISHDSDNATGEDIEKINQTDSEHKIPATTFMSYFDGDIKSWKGFRKRKLDLQYHHVHLYHYHPKGWIKNLQRMMGDSALFQGIQFWFFNAQKFIFDKLSLKKSTGVRNHGLVWNTHYDQPVWLEKKKSNLIAHLDRITKMAFYSAPVCHFSFEIPKRCAKEM